MTTPLSNQCSSHLSIACHCALVPLYRTSLSAVQLANTRPWRYSTHYAAATALAFIASTFANWLLGRLILFRDAQKSKAATAKELLKIYAVSVAGLVMNLAIMFVAVEECAISEMPAKILATGIVFAWNFLIRKLMIYRI